MVKEKSKWAKAIAAIVAVFGWCYVMGSLPLFPAFLFFGVSAVALARWRWSH